MSSYTRILGIDVGICNVGWSVLRINGDLWLVDYNRIKADQFALVDKIGHIAYNLKCLIDTYDIRAIAFEDPVFVGKGKNGPDLQKVVGVIYYLAYLYELPVYRYTASAVKKQVTGNGKANKKDVENAVRNELKLDDSVKFKTDHESDAVAVALTFYKRDY
jgi:crossover junction endodeoxyribonuclease RuvC